MESNKSFLMRIIGDDYRLNFMSLFLIVIGTVFAEFTYFTQYPIAYTAVGISSAIIGVTIMLVPRHRISKEIALHMMMDSYANYEAVLTQFTSNGSCKYMPPTGGYSQVKIPVNINAMSKTYEEFTNLVDSNGEIAICMPLSQQTLSELSKKGTLEQKLNRIIRNHFELVKGLKITESKGQYLVQLNGYQANSDYPLTKKTIGCEPTSITGCVLSAILDKPITLVEEEYRKIGVKSTFKIVD
jgi:hypothetical protein